ncbi:MAG: hypothetical protein BGP16_18205 [Sphingobium sp. 66-54]|nr:MAG: hypothetical protein BGP16_18205 [Sphingobium sp. 66-54]
MLTAALGAATDGDRLAPLLAAGERERAAGEKLEQDFRAKRAALGGYDEEIARLERQIEQDRRALEAARADWEAEQAAIVFPLDLADVEGRLSLVDELRGELDKVHAHDQCIAGIEADQRGRWSALNQCRS